MPPKPSKPQTQQRRPQWPILTLLFGLLAAAAGCSTQPEEQPQPVAVTCQRVPAPPAATLQPPTPEWCSPTCSDALNKEFEALRRLLMPEEPLGKHVSPSAVR